MKNYHTVTVKYFGPTNTKGSRVKLTSARFEQSVTIPYNYQFDNATDIAVDWLTENGHDVVGVDGWAGVIVIDSNEHSFKKLREQV